MVLYLTVVGMDFSVWQTLVSSVKRGHLGLALLGTLLECFCNLSMLGLNKSSLNSF